MMRLILLCFFLSLSFLSNASDFRIHGNVSKVPDGTILYLRLVGPPAKDVDSVTVINGKFEFKGEAPTVPTWFTLSIKGKFVPLTDLYIEAGDILVEGELYNCIAKGTKTNDEYVDYKVTLTPLYSQVADIHNAMAINNDPSRLDSFKDKLIAHNDKLDKAELDYIRKYPASVISLHLLGYKSSHMNGEQINYAISLLDVSLQNTKQVKDMKEYAKRLIGCAEGTKAPDFTLKTKDGNNFSLSERKSKYILIDFWASWCAPCRNALPHVAQLNEMYKKENFEIIGVSLDNNIDKWKKALAEDNCTWIQVCDTTGHVARLYAVSAIPLMVLISPDGTILKRILKKEDLDDILSGLFK